MLFWKLEWMGASWPPTEALAWREGWKLLLVPSRQLCRFDMKTERVWISRTQPVFLG